MARYIDADKVYQDLIEEYPSFSDRILKVDYDDIRGIVMNFIDDAPTEEVKPIFMGEWIMLGNDDLRGFSNKFECSNCEEITQITYEARECPYNYCPHCGAKMESEEEE